MKIKLEDKRQDFLKLIVDKKGVISGNSLIFRNGRLTLLGIGTLNGDEYLDFEQLTKGDKPVKKDIFVYFKQTGENDPLPWKAETLKYKVTSISN